MKMKRAVVNLTVRVTVDVPAHIYERDIEASKADCEILGDEFDEAYVWSDWAGDAVLRRVKAKVGPNADTDLSELVAEVDGCEILDEPEDVDTDGQAGCGTCTGAEDGVYPHDECSSCCKWPHQEGGGQ